LDEGLRNLAIQVDPDVETGPYSVVGLPIEKFPVF
jgi:hypothetical protein